MKIRFESSSARSSKKTGVGYYADRLVASMRKIEGAEVVESQFNFLGRQLPKGTNVESINFPQKIYAKLAYYGIAFPFDLTLRKTDVTIFPNYALWPTIKSKKNVVTIHDLSFLKYPDVVEAKNLAYLQRIVPYAVKNADLILTVSESVKHELIEEYSVEGSRIHVTPIPPTESYFVPSNRDVHTRYSIPTKKYILFASTIEPRKNLGALLDAYGLLPKDLRDTYSLVIAGGVGWNSEDIQNKLASMRKKHKNIVQTGYYDQADAAALYQQASVFVMPSFYEGFGMPLLEAMAGGTPTIASDIPVLREVGGDASIYFPPDNPGTLASHLTQIMTDSRLSKTQVRLGDANVKRYSWDIVAKELYEKLQVITKQ